MVFRIRLWRLSGLEKVTETGNYQVGIIPGKRFEEKIPLRWLGLQVILDFNLHLKIMPEIIGGMVARLPVFFKNACSADFIEKDSFMFHNRIKKYSALKPV